MKNSITILFLLLVSGTSFSQHFKYAYTGRFTPSVKKEKLNDVKFINDITPQFWQKLGLPYKERETLDQRRKTDFALVDYLYPQGVYNALINYVSVEISATCNNKILTAKGTSDELTTEQKNILNSVDPGSDINIRIGFSYKDGANGFGSDREIIEGKLAVTVVPETEAEYPGGFKQLSTYLTEAIFNKISGASAFQKINQSIVTFTVNEEGKVVNAKMITPSSDPQLDKLVLDAIHKMPVWEPAKNSKGIKVKQEFSIPFGGDSGC